MVTVICYSTRLTQKGLLAGCSKRPPKHAGKKHLARVRLLEGEGWREQAAVAGAVALPAHQALGLPRAE